MDDGIQTGRETGILSPTHLKSLLHAERQQLHAEVDRLKAEIYARSHMAPKNCICWVCTGGKK